MYSDNKGVNMEKLLIFIVFMVVAGLINALRSILLSKKWTKVFKNRGRDDLW